MKLIKYKILSNGILTDVSVECGDYALEETLNMVESEAYNGEYTVEEGEAFHDDPSAEDILNTLLGVTR